MRNVIFVIGAILIAAGLLGVSGMLKYQDKETVAEFGKLEIEATREKTAPPNWGYLMLGTGVLVVAVGAFMRKP